MELCKLNTRRIGCGLTNSPPNKLTPRNKQCIIERRWRKVRNPRKVYTKEFKVQVCEAYTQSDRTLADVEREHGLNSSLFSKWVRIYERKCFPWKEVLSFLQYCEKGFLLRGSKGLTLRPIPCPVHGRNRQWWPPSVGRALLPNSQGSDITWFAGKNTILRDQLASRPIPWPIRWKRAYCWEFVVGYFP